MKVVRIKECWRAAFVQIAAAAAGAYHDHGIKIVVVIMAVFTTVAMMDELDGRMLSRPSFCPSVCVRCRMRPSSSRRMRPHHHSPLGATRYRPSRPAYHHSLNDKAVPPPDSSSPPPPTPRPTGCACLPCLPPGPLLLFLHGCPLLERCAARLLVGRHPHPRPRPQLHLLGPCHDLPRLLRYVVEVTANMWVAHTDRLPLTLLGRPLLSSTWPPCAVVDGTPGQYHHSPVTWLHRCGHPPGHGHGDEHDRRGQRTRQRGL